MNLDPANIKCVILTHGHADHVGGAKYLQDTFKPHVMLSAADWDMIENNQNFRGPKPVRDMAVVDGQKLTLGDETITLFVTPGHTPGGLSLLIPVKDGGTTHIWRRCGEARVCSSAPTSTTRALDGSATSPRKPVPT